MIKRPTIDDIGDLRGKVDALRAHIENRTATNQLQMRRSWFDRRLDAPTFVLAVIGAVFSIAAAGAFLWPLARLSYKFWVGA